MRTVGQRGGGRWTEDHRTTSIVCTCSPRRQKGVSPNSADRSRHRGHGVRRRSRRQMPSSVHSTQASMRPVSQLRCFVCGSAALGLLCRTAFSGLKSPTAAVSGGQKPISERKDLNLTQRGREYRKSPASDHLLQNGSAILFGSLEDEVRQAASAGTRTKLFPRCLGREAYCGRCADLAARSAAFGKRDFPGQDSALAKAGFDESSPA